MAQSDRPQSPFAGMVDLSARTPARGLSPDEIERMLAEHRLYLGTEYHQGHHANFSSTDHCPSVALLGANAAKG
jgi:hypothetical protein